MENQTTLKEIIRASLESLKPMVNMEQLKAFKEELTPEEQTDYLTMSLAITRTRLEAVEEKANFAAAVITTLAVTAIAVVGIKNVKEELDKKKERRQAADLIIEGYLNKTITLEELKGLTQKKDYKYVNKMTNESIFTKEKK